MKKRFLVLLTSGLVMTLLPGCLVLDFEGSKRNSPSSTNATTNTDHTVGQEIVNPTLGQQLIDLQKAKDAGAITDTEYQAQKANLLKSH